MSGTSVSDVSRQQNTPSSREALRNTPQIDDLPANITFADDERCGGAIMAAAVVISGGDAIAHTVKGLGRVESTHYLRRYVRPIQKDYAANEQLSSHSIQRLQEILYLQAHNGSKFGLNSDRIFKGMTALGFKSRPIDAAASVETVLASLKPGEVVHFHRIIRYDDDGSGQLRPAWHAVLGGRDPQGQLFWYDSLLSGHNLMLQNEDSALFDKYPQRSRSLLVYTPYVFHWPH